MSVWASWRHRPAPGYVPADGAYRAVAAPLWRRGTASALDWFLVFVLFILAGYPLGMIETLGDAIGGPAGRILFYGAEALALAIVPAYFAYFLATGHTLGMRALDIHVFSHGSGREPHLVQAVARSLLALLFFYFSFKAYTLVRGFHGNEGLSEREELWRDVALTVVGVAVLGNLWKLADPDGRTLWDRLVGLVVVEDVVPASMPGRLWSPWGT
jgi:uncharacterized RDD family membrane protein YckC